MASLRYVNDTEHQAWVIHLIRSLFAVLASAQLLHAAFTYRYDQNAKVDMFWLTKTQKLILYSCLKCRDYDVLNHQILLGLVDKVNGMQSKREISWDDEDTESEVDWTSWVDTDLTDDDDNLGDPDYKIPLENKGSPVITSSMTRRLYNFRPR